MSKANLFIDDTELCQLTGRKFKSKQISWLRDQGIPFRVSATGHPVVTRIAVEGRETAQNDANQHEKWVPKVLQGGR